MHWRSRGAPVEKRERADLLLLALASLLLRGGERVAMIEPDARPISGRSGLDRLAAATRPARRTTMPGCRRLSLCRDTPAWCCSATFLSPLTEIQATIGRLAAVPVSGYLLQVLDPAEADLPYHGRSASAAWSARWTR